MSYHDRNNYQTRWSNPEKEKSTKNPKIKIISPQKKLIDIQKILNDAHRSMRYDFLFIRTSVSSFMVYFISYFDFGILERYSRVDGLR